MKSRSIPLVLVLSLLLVVARAWTKEDHEIFRLRDEVAQAEGANVTFYSILGVPPSATQPEIKSALRKKSMRLHPDKAIPSLIAQREATKATRSDKKSKSGVKVSKGLSQKERAKVQQEANDRWARFGVIASVLKSEDARERYDHFLKNGFPTWKGTGYYYARFRPGLGSVLFGLAVVFGGFMHYGAMYISWKRQRDFVQRYVTHARKMAWGNDSGMPGIPEVDSGVSTAAAPPPEAEDDQSGGALNRRQKRQQEKESKKKDTTRVAKTARSRGISKPMDGEPMEGPQGSRKKVIAENGKVLIVDSVGDVFLEQESAEGQKHEYLLDPEEIPKPTILSTALFRLPIWTFNQTIGRGIDMVRGTSELQEEGFLDEEGEDLMKEVGPSADGHGAMQTAVSVNQHDETKKRKSKSKR